MTGPAAGGRRRFHVNFQFGPHHGATRTGRCTRRARDEHPAAHETTEPEHRLAGASLQSLSEVGVPRIQPPEKDVAHEEQYRREDEDGWFFIVTHTTLVMVRQSEQDRVKT
jgi:hypothetical protein